MAVERQLVNYWTNALNYHQTGEDIWLSLINIMSLTGVGVEGRAARRFMATHDLEVMRDSSG